MNYNPKIDLKKGLKKDRNRDSYSVGFCHVFVTALIKYATSIGQNGAGGTEGGLRAEKYAKGMLQKRKSQGLK
ncbi:MAG: hypothetical protein R6U69_11265 [Marinobacter sp.]|uniref:hypothetical protein n=1 Tax=Marinobacter sp. TaxID=50741 RepID=UPI003975378A